MDLSQFLRMGAPSTQVPSEPAEGLHLLADVIDATQRSQLNHFLMIQKLARRRQQFSSR
jgi:hypothetical protein